MPGHPLQSVIDAQPHYLKNLESSGDMSILIKDPTFDPNDYTQVEEIPLSNNFAVSAVVKLTREGWHTLAVIMYKVEDKDNVKVCLGKPRTIVEAGEADNEDRDPDRDTADECQYGVIHGKYMHV